MISVRRLEDGEVERVASVLGLARLFQGDGFYIVAWDGAEPLGHAYLALGDPPELQDVAVRLPFRRRGVGSALTATAVEEARRAGADRLRLEVSVDNDAAQQLYRRCAFVALGMPARRVLGQVTIRTGTIDVDDTLLTFEKRLDR